MRGFREVGGGVWSPSGKLKLGTPPSEQFIPRTPPPPPSPGIFLFWAHAYARPIIILFQTFFLIGREAPVHLLNLLYIALWYSSKKKNHQKTIVLNMFQDILDLLTLGALTYY